MRTLCLGALGLLLLAGCGEADDGVPDEPWMEAPNYTYTVASACGEQWFLGTFEVTVEAHVVVDASALDGDGQRLLDLKGLEYIPTLDELVAKYRDAVNQNADEASIEHAPGDGHPTKIEIDWSYDAIDDESCYTIGKYEVAR